MLSSFVWSQIVRVLAVWPKWRTTFAQRSVTCGVSAPPECKSEQVAINKSEWKGLHIYVWGRHISRNIKYFVKRLIWWGQFRFGLKLRANAIAITVSLLFSGSVSLSWGNNHLWLQVINWLARWGAAVSFDGSEQFWSFSGLAEFQTQNKKILIFFLAQVELKDALSMCAVECVRWSAAAYSNHIVCLSQTVPVPVFVVPRLPACARNAAMEFPVFNPDFWHTDIHFNTTMDSVCVDGLVI